MRRTAVVLAASLVLALAFAAGCAKRQLTASETGRLDAIAAKIIQAEGMGAKECAPKELARAKVLLDHASHEYREKFEDAEKFVKEAEAAADDLLAKTKACAEAKQKGAALPGPAEAQVPKAEMPPAEAVAPKAEAQAPAEARPTAPAEAPVQRAEGPAGAKAVEGSFENIHFDFDKSDIRSDAKPILRTIADYMKKRPEVKVKIEGHCDERGTSEYNMALGDRRAHAASKYLQSLGIAGKRLSTVSYGKERPLDSAHNEEAWAKNRRAVFIIRP